MKNSRLITVLFFIIVVGAALAARVYYLNSGIDTAVLSFDMVFVVEHDIDKSELFRDGITLESIYLYLLLLSCMVFGNFVVAGLYLNVLLQTITVILVFLALNIAVNRYVGFISGIAMVELPMYLSILYDFSGINLWGPICGAVLLLAALLMRILHRKINGDLEDCEDLDMKEIIPEEIEKMENTETKITNYIENPLPVPKRKEHKQMDYAVEVDENDDYDIKDMTGRDFFDIE